MVNTTGPAQPAPERVSDIDPDKLYTVEEIAHVGKVTPRQLREGLARTGIRDVVRVANSRQLLRIPGRVAIKLLTAPADDVEREQGAPVVVQRPADRTGEYADPIRRRNRY